MNLTYHLSLSELMDFFYETTHQGFSFAEINAAEKRLGVLLPQTYRHFLAAYGKDSVNTYYNQLIHPQEICSNYELIQEELECDWGPEFQEAVRQGQEADYAEEPYFQLWQLPPERWNTITEEYILIWFENQGIWSAGYRKKDLLNGVQNPPIYISVDDDISYHKSYDSTVAFLIRMLYEAAYGWHDGERFTNPSDIKRVFSNTGIDLERLCDPLGNGTCLCQNQLYFYDVSETELRIANRTPFEHPTTEIPSKELPLVNNYRPKYGPRRLALLPFQMQDLGMSKPIPLNGIPLHPMVALLLQQYFNHEPSTAYDWSKDIGRVKSLTIEPRFGTTREKDAKNIYIYPPGEHFAPAPYYFDLRDWSVIGRMTKLQSLTIHHIYVEDFSFLRDCKNLKNLSLYNTNFSDCRLLSELPNLKELNLSYCPLEHTEALQNLPLQCTVNIN